MVFIEPSLKAPHLNEQIGMLRLNAGKPEYSLIPFSFWDQLLAEFDEPESINREMLEGITRVLMFGSAKYAPFNWAKGGSWRSVANSAYRHLLSSLKEDNDPESGHPHLAHFGCNLVFLIDFVTNNIGTDDRRKLDPPPIDHVYRSESGVADLLYCLAAWTEGGSEENLKHLLVTLNEIYPQ